MCDCYESICSCCGAPVPVHIGDFSTARGCVEVYCPKPECRKTLLHRILGKATHLTCYHGPPGTDDYGSPLANIYKANPRGRERSKEGLMVFTDVQESGPWKGKAFVFLVESPRSIVVNGSAGKGRAPKALRDEIAAEEKSRRQRRCAPPRKEKP